MHLGADVRRASRLSGGDVNDVYLLETANGYFVLKATRRPLPQFFFAESQGLHLLRSGGPLSVPEVIAHGDAPGGYQYLLLSYLPPVPESDEAHESLGRGLAQLHRCAGEVFGGRGDNYLGWLPQVNTAATSAAEFYWHSRLEPQLKLAGKHLSSTDLGRFELVRGKLPQIIPAESPALVHGDLWHGNVLYSTHGPALIDPAAAFSHREVDLAALHLFGAPPQHVLDAYQEANPLAPNWQKRVPLWNLYPLLAHLNMFGVSYLGRVRQALDAALLL